MIKIFESPAYQLFAERKVTGEVVSVSIYSVWPLVRNPENATPHRLLNLNLPQEALDKIAEVFQGK